ncbi:MAG: methyltransferase domain-containing protein [Chitinophagaceae bacterium]|nr:MAG: methyltransferase domain-containing protein [Chitinophagaceae bacterium]
MPWDPDTYNQFKEIRYRPFYDLVALIDPSDVKTVVDLGCGTGEQTSILSQKLSNAHITGIDSSEEMLKESERFVTQKVRFRKASIQDFLNESSTCDLVFSNAALQWEDSHLQLFPAIISRLKSNGQLAIQMPYQKENILNSILLGLVNEEPFSVFLNEYIRDSPLLTIDEYATILFQAGLENISIALKVYPLIAKDEMELFKFISGSALVPYFERLNTEQQNHLSSTFLVRIRQHFKNFPAIYPFKRLLMYGRKPQS